MKEGIIIGMLVGLVLGAFITQSSPAVQDIVQKGKDEVKKTIQKI